MKNNLEIAIKAARAGAAHALKYYKSDIEVEFKENLSPVTIADKEAEEVIKNIILEQDPSAKFVGEESGGNFDEEKYWLIDPIDGTGFFIRGIPMWGTLLSYIESGQAVTAVSYLPLLDELLYAKKDKGAYLNDFPIKVSGIEKVSKAMLTHGSIHKIIDKLPGIIELSKKSHKMKGISESYGYHLLATGRTEGVFDGGASPWDVAGLNMIVEEAGGKVTNFKGNKWSIHDNNIIATNGLIHDEILKILAE